MLLPNQPRAPTNIPCHIKDPSAGAKREMAALHVAIKKILEADHPQTVRQVFYQLVTRNLVKKTELEYKLTVIRLLTDMRFSGEVKWAWIVDSSRQGQVTRTFDSVTDALNHTAEHYRRSAMRESDVYIEI